jgi:tetratricopeptide (TPR) repeat protein
MSARMKFRALFAMVSIAALPLFAQGSENDNEECIKNIQILQDNVKSNDFEYALPVLKFLMDECYTLNTGIFVYGEQMLFALIADSAYAHRAEGLTDTLFLLYDLRLKAAETDPKFGTEAFIIGRKVKAFAKLKTREYEFIYTLAKKAVSLGMEETDAQVMFLYMQYTAILKKLKKLECEDVIEVYNELNDFIDVNIDKYEGMDSLLHNNYLIAQAKVDQLAGPCLTCESLIEIFKREYATRKNDAQWIKKAAAALDKKKCAKTDEFKDDPIIFSIIEQNVNLNPSAKGWILVGRQYALKNDCAKSIQAFQRAIELENNLNVKTNYMKFLAGRYMECGDYSAARGVARKITELRPQWGWPYLFIGDLYANSLNRCKSDDLNKCTQYAVYWAAADKYAQAKNIDPEFSGIASGRLARMAGSFPLKSDCFMNDIREGESFTVGCWIGETTTVRIR